MQSELLPRRGPEVSKYRSRMSDEPCCGDAGFCDERKRIGNDCVVSPVDIDR